MSDGFFGPHKTIIGAGLQLTAFVVRGVEYVLGAEARDVRQHDQSARLRERGAGLVKLFDPRACGNCDR